MQRIRKGDEVVVISGRDKAQDLKHVDGGIVDLDKPIDVSNIALFNPATKKADRAGIKALEDGRKVRVFKANGEQVDV